MNHKLNFKLVQIKLEIKFKHLLKNGQCVQCARLNWQFAVSFQAHVKSSSSYRSLKPCPHWRL